MEKLLFYLVGEIDWNFYRHLRDYSEAITEDTEIALRRYIENMIQFGAWNLADLPDLLINEDFIRIFLATFDHCSIPIRPIPEDIQNEIVKLINRRFASKRIYLHS